MSESVYLHDVPLDTARARFEEALREAGRWERLGVESVSIDESLLGRVLAEPIFARLSSPHYHASAMDGFAVLSKSTAGAHLTFPVVLSCQPEDGFPQAQYLDTGDPLPEWADAVIPIESVEPLTRQGSSSPDPRRPAAIRIRAAMVPWSHVRPMGEDMVASQLVLPAGHKLRPVDLGALIGAGHSTVKVSRKPRVAILPTGSELVPPGVPVEAGDIIEYNSLVLAAQVNQWGGHATRVPITPDDFELICQRVKEAAREHDLILINAGSSAGSEDFSARVVASLGKLLVHGVAVRPGHPVILGMLDRPDLGDTIPIIGVPGYPVSAALTGEIFVEPLINQWLGSSTPEPEVVTATLTRKVTSPAGDIDYLRVVVGRVGEKLLAAPLSRGAGVITSLVRADGIAILAAGTQGMQAGAQVEVRLYTPSAQLEHTIFAIGSHDISLDMMAEYLAGHNRRLSSANVGSQGGLVALRRGEAHLAGSHLLDPQTGGYNLAYIPQYLPGVPVRVITLVYRQQGLMVAPGNPKNVNNLSDLANPEIHFVNRQRGAGTRVLLDYHLTLLDIATDSIVGYNQEEYTHLAVAAAVASGRADCGLGIPAAAAALGLDFIPLYQERYDLIIPLEYADSPLLEPFYDILHDPRFRGAVDGLPGYDVSAMGDVVAELGGSSPKE